jgi:hypothetical protein
MEGARPGLYRMPAGGSEMIMTARKAPSVMQSPNEAEDAAVAGTIPPKGYKQGKYCFNIADDAEKVTVTAKLRYRSFSQGLADLLLGKGAIKVPSVEVVTIEVTCDVGTPKTTGAGTAEH